MRHILIFSSLSVAILGCQPADPPSTAGDGGSASASTSDGSGGAGGGDPCAKTDGTLPPECSGCVDHPAGFLCWGRAEEPIHGECGEHGSCLINDYTCSHGEPGQACEGGVCVAPADEQTENTCCRQGCVDVHGLCVIGGGWHYGKPCAGL
jgi:hypothetical protein